MMFCFCVYFESIFVIVVFLLQENKFKNEEIVNDLELLVVWFIWLVGFNNMYKVLFNYFKILFFMFILLDFLRRNCLQDNNGFK